ncbi:hypothetical protein PAMC26577_14185 [Caballeronia sordidicola]|uniref:Uncharacterized protein n=1 Tax=Caballeronia sordidicola TaxID=196367 RepID=A0A242MVV4_CABSO|nr:hypothetical protein PAMC26577_14185 [Caballeronia sordidicola]
MFYEVAGPAVELLTLCFNLSHFPEKPVGPWLRRFRTTGRALAW